MKNCKSFNVLLLTVVALLLLAQPVGAQGENPSASNSSSDHCRGQRTWCPGGCVCPYRDCFQEFRKRGHHLRH